jgi:ATP-dependent DNA helicase RecG
MAKKIKYQPEEYMQMAIDAMMRSVDEPRDDGKVSPKVGAVILKPDGSIDTACRGELRHGDHAEFTLLERKSRSEKLDGSILFATLEPCAPGARKSPKLSCAERIVNARIAEIWIGIEDPDPDVDRKGIKFLEDSGVKVHMFYPEYQKKIKNAIKDFLSQAIERANERTEQKEVVLSVMEKNIPTASIEQFSEEAITYYLDKTKLNYKINSKELWEHFENACIVERIKQGNKMVYAPTGFGILLFGVNPRERYQQAVVKAKVKYGSNESIPKDFEGPLVLIPSMIEQWLQQILHSNVSREKFERKTETIFPIEPLREAIINALAHRDYDLEGAKTYISIDDDKIEIKSAGLPVSPISLNDVKAFKAPSLSRNPKITYVFNKMGLMEESELGMETFRGMQEKYRLPRPFYDFNAPYLTLTFSRSLESVKTITGRTVLNDLSKEELVGVEVFRSHEPISKKDFAKQMELPDRTAERMLKKFVDLKLILKHGSGPNTTYLINE